jgi:hypothetical protein
VVVGGHQRREAVLLLGIRVSARLEQQPRDLEAGVWIRCRHRAVQRHHLQVVAGRRVHGRTALHEQACGIHVAEERGKAQRLEPVAGPRVRERAVAVEQLAQPLGTTEGGRLEDVEVAAFGELLRLRAVTSIDRLEDAAQRSNLDSRRSLSTRPPVWQSGQ